MNHFCRIGEIKVGTKLSAEEAYNIAKKYHRMKNIDGMIPKDICEAVYLDEYNHITKTLTWMIRSKLERNTFEGMDELTIMVSDCDGQVCNVLDYNGMPVRNEKEQPYSDEEFYEIFDEDEIL